MRKRTRVDGVTLGNINLPPDLPPPPPIPPPPRRRQVGSHGKPIDVVVRELVSTFAKDAGPRRARAVLERMDGPWHGAVRLLASDLLEEGLSAPAFVRFVCAGVRRLRGRAPYAAEVFAEKGRAVWLGIYRRDAASHLDLPGRVATREEHRAHFEWMRACRTTSATN